MEKLQKQIDFIVEIDKMKSVFRQTKVIETGKFESDAAHSFHVALMADVLADYSDRPIDKSKVIKMLLIHDIVEIDAGDTYAYDYEGYKTKEDREKKAANRIFGLLDEEKKKEYMDLFFEFDNLETDDSLFANTIDRLQPIMLNYYRGGGSWEEHGIKIEQVYKRIEPMKKISTKLYEYTKGIIDNYFLGEEK